MKEFKEASIAVMGKTAYIGQISIDLNLTSIKILLLQWQKVGIKIVHLPVRSLHTVVQ